MIAAAAMTLTDARTWAATHAAPGHPSGQPGEDAGEVEAA